MKRNIYFSKPLMNAVILPPPVYVGPRVWCMAGLAGVAALDEEPEHAAFLWGAAEALRQSIGVREVPASHATHKRLKAEVRNELGDTVFNTKWAEGQSASMKKAIAEATQ